MSLQHKGSWRRRSLIDDARFDAEINAELEREEDQKDRAASAGGEGQQSQAATDEVTVGEDDVFGVTNGVKTAGGEKRSTRKCVVVFSAREAGGLSRIFKVFEVGICDFYKSHTRQEFLIYDFYYIKYFVLRKC